MTATATSTVPVADGDATRRVPARALGISALAFVAPVVAELVFPSYTSDGVGTLVWLSALIPPFLLAYYRGLRGVAVALAGGMAVITATQVSVVAFDIAEPNWTLLAGIVAVYLVVSLGVGLLAEALQRERRSAQDLAFFDRLTGLANRRQLDLALESAFAAARRGQPLAVALFDLDHFKRVNDVHGHAAGDGALQEFAAVLRANTRGENLSARFGGEEFVTILNGADGPAATTFAERVLAQLRARTFAWGRQTVSAGIAVYTTTTASPEALLAVADHALYASKDAGRDRITVAHADATRPQQPPPEPAVAGAPRARIWLVDDDRDVRGVARATLVRRKYHVWDTDDPRELVRRFADAAPADRPDAIVTDVIMPGMTGMTMVAQLMTVSSGVRVVYMSGYMHGTAEWHAGPGSAVAFVDKPFTPDSLIAGVEAVLNAPIAPAPTPAT